MKRVFIVLLLAITALAGCVQEADLMALEQRVQAQEQRVSQLDSQVSETSAVVGEIRPKQADLWAEIEELRVQMASLTGRMDDVSRRMNTMGATSAERTEVLASLERDVRNLKNAWNQAAAQLALDIELEPQPTAAPLPTAPPTDSPEGNATAPAFSPEQTAVNTLSGEPEEPATAAGAAPEPNKDPSRILYDRGRAQFEARNYAAAQAIWQEFASTFPDHELVSNALFWQGESFYQMGDYARAILAYQEVIGKYPKSNKYPTALLKQGISFMKIGKEKAGKLLLNDVVKKFPETAEARRAKQVLQNQ